jgi:hypothetical protein
LAANRISVKEKHEIIKEKGEIKKLSLKERIKNLYLFFRYSKIRKSELRKKFKKGEKYLFDEKPDESDEFIVKH